MDIDSGLICTALMKAKVAYSLHRTCQSPKLQAALAFTLENIHKRTRGAVGEPQQGHMAGPGRILMSA